MQRSLMLKIFVIGLLALGLYIPLAMIHGTVSERAYMRTRATESIADGASSHQRVTGPVLIVPYRKKVLSKVTDEATKKQSIVEQFENGSLRFLPNKLSIDVNAPVETKHRGIYEALLYIAGINIEGDFILPKNLGITDNLEDYSFRSAYVAVGITDNRGIRGTPILKWGDNDLTFSPGADTALFKSGIHINLGKLDASSEKTYPFSANMNLRGTGQLEFTPIGKETRVKMRSPWPHPSFIGRYLPDSSSIYDGGFTAQWQTTHISTNIGQLFDRCNDDKCAEWMQASLGTSFIQPVDIYQQAERSVKYGFLFIALTFVAFFLFEVLKRLAIHPIQYSLVGISLALFFLLLVSLSEHIAFGKAYLIAAFCCVALIGYYVSHVLQSYQRAIGFATALATIYAALYVLIRAEDYALMMGSILLFVLLGLVMLVTRKINWYEIGKAGAVSTPVN